MGYVPALYHPLRVAEVVDTLEFLLNHNLNPASVGNGAELHVYQEYYDQAPSVVQVQLVGEAPPGDAVLVIVLPVAFAQRQLGITLDQFVRRRSAAAMRLAAFRRRISVHDLRGQDDPAALLAVIDTLPHQTSATLPPLLLLPPSAPAMTATAAE
jgi:3-deoxy-D-arabino-heptulosonate 7-phosphate (DAHP) synthase